MNLTSQLESLLFVASKPLSVKQLAKVTGAPEAEVKQSLTSIALQRQHSGVVLLEAGGNYQLATNAENSEVVKYFLNAELREKLTEATVEVLGIIAYRQPISKAEIESIRGVNSQYSIRHLLMRGLIEKVANPGDARSSLYQVTTEFLQHLGIVSVKDLPEFSKLVEKIKLPETPQGIEQAPQEPTVPQNETSDQT